VFRVKVAIVSQAVASPVSRFLVLRALPSACSIAFLRVVPETPRAQSAPEGIIKAAISPVSIVPRGAFIASSPGEPLVAVVAILPREPHLAAIWALISLEAFLTVSGIVVSVFVSVQGVQTGAL
jgi:hypothetical protein